MTELNKIILWIKEFTIKNYPRCKERYGILIPSLWVLIIIVIFLNIFYNFQNFILVGLAALLASATVIRNIENTNKIEKEKIKRELFDRRKKVIFSISDLFKEVTEKLNNYNSLQEVSSLKEIDNFNEDEYIKECIPNLLNKEHHFNRINEIIDSLHEAEFIFNEVHFKELSPLMDLLLKYYKELSIEKHDLREISLEQKINSCSKLSNMSYEVLHTIKDSIKLV